MQSPGGGPGGQAPKKFHLFNPYDTLDCLILNAFSKQNTRNKGNVNVSPLETFVNLVLEEP